VNPDAWARAREVFGDAVQRRSDERDAYLDEACSSDPALRAGGRLPRGARWFTRLHRTTSLRSAADPWWTIRVRHDGRLIGPHIIRQEIGRGGMGTVYPPMTRLSRRVAVKALLPEVGRDPRRRERLVVKPERRRRCLIPTSRRSTLEEIGDELHLVCE
jgi:hypothetical protein